MNSTLQAYLACMLWSTNDNATESGGEPLDRNYCIDDIHQSVIEQATADCNKLEELFVDFEIEDFSQLGHDFWLTRCGHGAGFWDGKWDTDKDPNRGDKMSDIVNKHFENLDPYVGDDGMIHI